MCTNSVKLDHQLNQEFIVLTKKIRSKYDGLMVEFHRISTSLVLLANLGIIHNLQKTLAIRITILDKTKPASIRLMLGIRSQGVKEDTSHLISICYCISSMVAPLTIFMSLFLLHKMWNVMNMDWSSVTMKACNDTETKYTGLQNDRITIHTTYWKLKHINYTQ